MLFEMQISQTNLLKFVKINEIRTHFKQLQVMTIKSICLILFCALWNEAAAQKIITYQSLYWLRYYNQLILNDKWVWHNEMEDRRFLETNRQHHTILHSRLHYKFFQNADIGIGATYSLQSPQNPYATTTLVVPEKRLVQELNLNNPMSKKFSLQQRLRIDERWIRKNDGKILYDGYDFNVRVRFRLQANYLISKSDAKNKTTLKMSDELMINVGNNIIYNLFDQNRIYLGMEQSFSKTISAELGYLYWFQQRSTGNQFFDRDIIRFTLLHRIPF
jgi:hypothetical protein